MASPPDYEQEQAHIATVLLPAVRAAYGLIDPQNLDESLSHFTAALFALVKHWGRVAASRALASYRAERAASGPVSLSVAPVPSMAATLAEWDVSAAFDPSLPSAADALAATAVRQVLTQGDETVLRAVSSDKRATGWARGLEPGACSFCQMLATTGAKFSKRSFVGSNALFKGTGTIKVHDNCACYPIAVFGRYTPDARVQRAQKLWDESTKGLSGAKARKAFRAAVEGRDHHPGDARKRSIAGPAQEPVDAAKALTPERRAELIANLEKSVAACRRSGLTKTVAAIESRLAVLRAA